MRARPDWEDIRIGPDGERLPFVTELEQDRRCFAMGRKFLREHAQSVPGLLVRKVQRLWAIRSRFTTMNRQVTLANLLSYGLVFPFFLVGLGRSLTSTDSRRRHIVLYFYIATIHVGVLLYYGSLRFRFPLEPLIILFGVYGAITVRERLGERRFGLALLREF